MVKFIKRISKTAGHIPGELVHVGDKSTDKVKISIIDYDEKKFQEKEVANIEEVFPFKNTSTIT